MRACMRARVWRGRVRVCCVHAQCVCACACVRVHACMRACVCVSVRACVRVCMYMCSVCVMACACACMRVCGRGACVVPRRLNLGEALLLLKAQVIWPGQARTSRALCTPNPPASACGLPGQDEHGPAPAPVGCPDEGLLGLAPDTRRSSRAGSVSCSWDLDCEEGCLSFLAFWGSGYWPRSLQA